MKELFIAIINGLKGYKITEAQMFSSGTFSTITFEILGETYTISISKAKKDGNDND